MQECTHVDAAKHAAKPHRLPPFRIPQALLESKAAAASHQVPTGSACCKVKSGPYRLCMLQSDAGSHAVSLTPQALHAAKSHNSLASQPHRLC